MAREFKDKTLDEIAERMGETDKDSNVERRAKAEFILRQTKAVLNTEEHNRKIAKYMLWTIVIMALSLVFGVIFQCITKGV